MVVDVRAGATRAAVEAEILSTYRERTAGSAARHEAARQVMPGGDTRTVAFHAPYPLYLVEGRGCRTKDVDGNEYVDFLNNYTSLIHGHAHPAVTAAVAAQAPRGTAFAAGFEAQIRLAEIMTERVASVDLIRFCNSGTEAVMNAIRAARAFTGRDLIVKMEGGYHGTYDDVEVSVHPEPADPAAGPDHAPLPVLDVRGVPRNTVDNVLVLPFNDVPAAERLLVERGSEIAAVIVEPVMGSAGMIPADPEFLIALRSLTIEQDVVLIFDEVMTFRLQPGGVQEHFRVRPDLTTFAKIIGGGFPVGAFGGREAIMAQFDPSRPKPLWQSGTFNGNAITMVAGIAAMEAYPAAEVARINGLGDRLRTGLNRLLVERGLPGEATGYGSFVNLHLTARNVRSYRAAAAGDRAIQRLMHLALLEEGIFAAPRLLCCISTAMDETIVDDAQAAFGRALDRIVPAISDTARGSGLSA
jgi:glutamate-1-semialdehyde 2,1-aminomutase